LYNPILFGSHLH